jgi:hypothetical protein
MEESNSLDKQNFEKYEGLAKKLAGIQEGADNPTPLEKTFNITPGSTPAFKERVEEHNPTAVTVTDPVTGEVIARDADPTDVMLAKEERIEDLQIDGKLNQIYDNAMTAFDSHANLAETADPRFSARNGEVAAQYLKIALDSTNSKIEAKYKRNKVRIARLGMSMPNTVQNNVIVADRNDLLKNIFTQDYERSMKEEFNT